MTQEIGRRLIGGDWVTNVANETAGGGARTEYVTLNGLVKDYDPPGGIDGLGALLFDPTAQPWQANTEYSNDYTNSFPAAFVVPTTNPNGVKFLAFENGSFVSGASEPDFAGGSPAADGTAVRPAEWSAQAIYNVWAALTPVTGNIFESGSCWSSDGGGNTGAVKPDFSSTETTATVVDGSVTWTNSGPAFGEWQPNTRYSFRRNAGDTTVYGQSFVVPVGATPGVDNSWNGQATGVFGTTGTTEPVGWEAATPGDFSVWIDGDIMWTETTAVEALVITGIIAPSAPTVITIACAPADPSNSSMTVVIEDEADVSSYGPDAASAAGNTFASGGSKTLSALNGNLVRYANAVWTAMTPGS